MRFLPFFDFVQLALTATLLLAAVPANAATPVDGSPPVMSNNPATRLFTTPSIFAYPGQNCPPDSEPFKGPEQAHAKSAGAVYCILRRKVIAMRKKYNSQCPTGTKTYTDPTLKPDDDVIWCELDPGYKFVPPPLPEQPKPVPSGSTNE